MSGIYGVFSEKKVSTDRIEKWNGIYGEDHDNAEINSLLKIGIVYENITKKIGDRSFPVIWNHLAGSIDCVLYNRGELIIEYGFEPTFSDEEIFLALFDKYGFQILSKINGDYAGAVYDERYNTLTLFRDHMGVRPLFYYANNGILAFSTDVRGILSLDGIDTDINENWVCCVLSGYSWEHLHETEYTNIYFVPPASYISFDLSGSCLAGEIKRYWRPGATKYRYGSESEYINKLRELVEDAVKRRLDVIPGKVGSELSGGLDSGVISVIINRFNRECNYYSWSASPDKVPFAENDERIAIRDICIQENINCNYADLTKPLGRDSFLYKSLIQSGIHIDEDNLFAIQMGMPPYVNTMTLITSSENMRENGARVVFSGHGGDEGVSHRSTPYELFKNGELFSFYKLMYATSKGRYLRPARALKKSIRYVRDMKKNEKNPFRNKYTADKILSAKMKGRVDASKLHPYSFSYSPKLYIENGGSIERLLNVALQGASVGVRYFIPYVDYRLIDFAVSIPRRLYLNGSQNRYIYREAFKDILPASVYSRKMKQSPSHDNEEIPENWHESFLESCRKICAGIDRERWSELLDFSFIDEWLQKEKPKDDDEYMKDFHIMIGLSMCAMAQSAMDKAKTLVD